MSQLFRRVTRLPPCPLEPDRVVGVRRRRDVPATAAKVALGEVKDRVQKAKHKVKPEYEGGDTDCKIDLSDPQEDDETGTGTFLGSDLEPGTHVINLHCKVACERTGEDMEATVEATYCAD